jgi:hypothetical protein
MSKNKIKFSESPEGNPILEFGYFLSEEEEQAFSNYLNAVLKAQREHIIELIKGES